jgi:hypothetical protein
MAFEENIHMAYLEFVGEKATIDVKEVVEAYNEKGSVDLIYFQVARRDIPYFQVGKGGEMRSVESSLTDEEEEGERPRSDGDSCRTVSRVNKDDEKLQNFIIEKDDQNIVMIIGGVKILLPSGRGEARTDVAEEA